MTGDLLAARVCRAAALAAVVGCGLLAVAEQWLAFTLLLWLVPSLLLVGGRCQRAHAQAASGKPMKGA